MTQAQLGVDIPMLAFPEWNLAQLFRDTSLRDLKDELSVQAASPHRYYTQPLWLARED